MVKIDYDYQNYGLSSDKYSLASEDTKDRLSKVMNSSALMDNLKVVLLNNSKLKFPIKVSKTSDIFMFVTGYHLIIEVNDILITLLEDNAEILIEQELSKVSVDPETSKIKIGKPTLVTNTALVKKYSAKEVIKANELSDLIVQHLDDLRENPDGVRHLIEQQESYLRESVGKSVDDGNWM
jgi:hypothetical protein